MLSSLISRIPMSIKIKQVMSFCGLTAEDKNVLDNFVNSIGGKPLVAILLGQEVTNIEGAVAAGLKFADESATSNSDVLRTAASALKSPQFRHVAARYILDSAKDAGASSQVTKILTTLSNLPVPELQIDVPDEASFIADVLLPFAGNHINKFAGDAEDHPMVAVTECPMCSHIYPVNKH